ncbi:MAG: glycerol-3-phosphate 1-O-acyltransferase PlsY [Aminobacterium colombiense]|jgi:glycerol-3-phosphate acyltransferase PlsY|uniref:Glycerol-3-phosphate acyltransferase n=1 Tax=Aminobacterium colombiense (strain DSM 12261 / ALA-1) TaxID=572547 RepID=D5EDR5_AMICL|nr:MULTISPECIES: glycerol-3-phosphate 1-O-acyltransferase PlsY [Aminobacterium]MDD2379251.1 glycerol-3-phosphate 1-O-acyltransferase PlsY [Aminobacterium colombiense]ADE56697.1 protein of unknown function DUF205 [Aminobacterium colombiense DSM 12261]MDD3767822.1 glycerol-3-phosphate 1-O-acyltransferase PlsY [Aminobacterium colombiense]MDD4265562.1 glycerol-3-phosphate 1-O-acyltransferase PlsY [Aminobacterium colombiense]MDD4585934.1 glycerol-3-phosphate 1-O-acyltransferase PlsY [Aminobacterium
MTNWMWILIAYLAGSFPTGYVFVKLFCGEDIRTFGSGNIGATNVGRRMGKKWAIIVTIIDMIKGGMVLVLARSMKVEGSSLLALMAFASVCGHNFPIWLKGKGGKGVATTFGVVFFMIPPYSSYAALAAGIIWYGTLKISRYVSVASIASLFSLPLIFITLKMDSSHVLAVLSMAFLALVRHKENIKRIRSGEENQVGKK